MIRKTTEAVCDNCDLSIYTVHEDTSYKEMTEKYLKNLAVIRYLPGRRNPYIFCDEKCLKEWADKNGYEV